MKKRPTFTLEIRVPLPSTGVGATSEDAGAAAGPKGTPVLADQASAYLAALKREVLSAAGDMPDSNVGQVNWVGGTAVNMTLAYWCDLVDSMQAQYPGFSTTRMRFDVGPELVSSKTVAYAFRFNTCFNVVMCALDDKNLALLGQARENMRGERFSNFGVQVNKRTIDAIGDQSQFASVLAQLKALETGYVRVVDDAGLPLGPAEGEGKSEASAEPAVPAWLPAALEEAGYQLVAPGLFATSAKYRKWFADTPDTDLMGFGLGAESHYAGARFVTTNDANEYIAKAGTSMDIYRVIS